MTLVRTFTVELSKEEMVKAINAAFQMQIPADQVVTITTGGGALGAADFTIRWSVKEEVGPKEGSI